jgi:acyl-coenzyme A thioesterase PaaI-like protein
MVLFRLLSAQLQTDGEHIKIAGRFHKDVWHTDAYGQNPAPFQRNPMLSPRQGPPYAWRPGILTWLANDALYPGSASFALGVDLTVYPAQLNISGDVPANAAPPGNPPQTPLQATSSSTGGTIAPGTYFIAITPNGRLGPVPPFFTTVTVPAGTSTNTITLSNIVWPAASMLNPSAFIGTSPLSLAYQRPGFTWTAGSPDAYGNPTEYTFTSVVDGRGLPDVNFNSFTVQQTNIVHGGVWGNAVDSISGGNVLSFPLASWTLNQWQNYTLSLYYRPDVPGGPTIQATGNVKVLSNTATTLTVDSGTGILAFQAGDIVVMRALAQSISPNTIGDPNFANSFAPSGLAVDGDAGNLIQIIAGTGAWTPPKTIASNTATVHTISGTWDITPDATSVYIVISPTSVLGPTSAVKNDGSWVYGTVASVPAASNGAQSMLIQVATTDADGNYFPMRYQPAREIYIPAQNTNAAAPPYIVPIVAGTATPDASRGTNLLILTAADCLTDANGSLYVNVAPPVNYSTASGAYTNWQLITQEDPVGGTGGYSTVFDASYKIGFAVASSNSPANTQCHVDFKTDSAGVTSPTGCLIDQPI